MSVVTYRFFAFDMFCILGINLVTPLKHLIDTASNTDEIVTGTREPIIYRTNEESEVCML